MLAQLRLLFSIAVALAAVMLAAAGAASVLGFVSGWLDGVTHFMPIWGAAGLVVLLTALLALSPSRLRIAAVICASASVLAALALAAPELVRAGSASRSAPSADDVTIVSHNIFKANVDPALTVAVLRAADADVVLLQEANLRPTRAVQRWLQSAYPYRVTCPFAARDCSLAIYSRFPVTERRLKPRVWVGDGWDPSMYLLARLEPPGEEPFTVATTHYGWPKPPWLQREQREGLLKGLTSVGGDDLILGGDFNSTPWSYFLREQDRTFGLERRTRALPTWPARFHGLPVAPFLPIDHIYAGRDWRTVEVRRLRKTGSDHYGVMVRLQRRSAEG